jgi:hypothetical protein
VCGCVCVWVCVGVCVCVCVCVLFDTNSSVLLIITRAFAPAFCTRSTLSKNDKALPPEFQHQRTNGGVNTGLQETRMPSTPKRTRTPSRSQFRSKKVSLKAEETKKRTTRFLHTRLATSSTLPTLAAKTMSAGSSRAAGARRCKRSRQAGLALRSSSHREHRAELDGALAASSSPSWPAAGAPACPPAGCPSILTTCTPGVR